jgi:hypothetical protein
MKGAIEVVMHLSMIYYLTTTKDRFVHQMLKKI